MLIVRAHLGIPWWLLYPILILLTTHISKLLRKLLKLTLHTIVFFL